MNPIKYYHDLFGNELILFQDANSRSINDRISIVSLIPAESYPGTFGRDAAIFRRLKNQQLFLMCFFFTALIDQAIHATLREEHPFFAQLTRYPKFVGILGTYHHNMHPGYLLLAATLYIPSDDRQTIINDFEMLVNFFIDDYCSFLQSEYPKLTGRMATPDAKVRAVRLVLSEIHAALQPHSIPMTLEPYTKQAPDSNLYLQWITVLRESVESHISSLSR